MASQRSLPNRASHGMRRATRDPRFATAANATVRFSRYAASRCDRSRRRYLTLKIAHRGSSGSHPENTISAFLAAAEEGADMCELDVQATRDGAVVVLHDESVDRTTDGVGAVTDLT